MNSETLKIGDTFEIGDVLFELHRPVGIETFKGRKNRRRKMKVEMWRVKRTPNGAEALIGKNAESDYVEMSAQQIATLMQTNAPEKSPEERLRHQNRRDRVFVRAAGERLNWLIQRKFPRRPAVMYA